MTHSARAKAFMRSVALTHTPSDDPDRHARDTVLHVLYLGTLGLIIVAWLVVCMNYLFLGLTHLAPRIIVISLVAVVMVALYIYRRQHYSLAAYSLLMLYFVAATAAVWIWGGENPVGVLLFALGIVFSGILLGARYALYALVVTVGVLGILTWLATSGIHRPDTDWADASTSFYDVVVFGIILGNLALISWVFTRSMEHSLQRARRSERALRGQKQLLEVKVEKRTREIQMAHLERIQEMYRFAELGHMSVGLLHDVANYLSVLSLDIEDLRQTRQNRSAVMGRVQESIQHLNSLVGQVRNQIKNESTIRRFNVAGEIAEVVKLLEYKAASSRVVLLQQNESPKSKLWCMGSVDHFRQVMTNLISNAIDAYEHAQKPTRRHVTVTARQTTSGIMVAVVDHGIGIPVSEQSKIFEPFYSSKKKGMGIGLAVTKRMVEKGFGGTIAVASDAQHGTIVSFTIPHNETTSADLNT